MSDPISAPRASGIDAKILAEHRLIRDLTRRLENSQDLRELLPRLAEFRSVLVAHFLSEIATDGLYDTLRAMAPACLERVVRLEREHDTLLADIDALSARVRACLAGPVAELFREVRALARRLADHEAAEDKILLDAVYDDLGQGDG